MRQCACEQQWNELFILVRWVGRYDVAMTSFKMTSLNLNTLKDHVSKRHKFCLMIVNKNNVICIKIVEIMTLFHVFLDNPSYFNSLNNSQCIIQPVCKVNNTFQHRKYSAVISL